MTLAVPSSRSPAAPRSSLPVLLVWAFVLALLVMSWRGADMRPLDLLRDSGNIRSQFARGLLPARLHAELGRIATWTRWW